MTADKRGNVQLRLQRAINKNWVLGVAAGVVFILTGNRRLGLEVMVGAALWNTVLYGNILWLQRESRRFSEGRR